MKKSLLILTFLILATPCFATSIPATWSFGIKAGADYPISKITVTDRQIFVTGGFSAEYIINDLFSLQTELNYFALTFSDSFQTWDYEGNQLPDVIYNEEYHFLQLPVLAKFQVPFTDSKDFCAFLNLGPALDIELGYTSNFGSAFSFRYKRIGAIIGTGINYILKTGSKITFEIRSEWIINTFKDTSDIGALNYENPNNSIFAASLISAMIGYIF